tara:strand:+ start:227 stop:694 length:468 start_codon:yes stop_codon:yes gene_type:complete
MAKEENIQARFRQAIDDALKEIASLAKKNILKNFDEEAGFTEKGRRVKWDDLDDDYVFRERGGSYHPMLYVKGDLRSAIEVKVTPKGIKTGVFSNKQKRRWKGDTIPLSEVSEHLSWKRPHSNPSPKFLGESKFIQSIFEKHTARVLRQLEKEGL